MTREGRNYTIALLVVAFARQGVAISTIARALVVGETQVRNACERALESGELLRLPPESADDQRSATYTEITHLRGKVAKQAALLREIRLSPMTIAEGLGSCFKLTRKEAAIVATLMQHGRVSKERLYFALYGQSDDPPDPKIIDVFVCKIRKKLPEGVEIKTIWGAGYEMPHKCVEALRSFTKDELPFVESPSLAPGETVAA